MRWHTAEQLGPKRFLTQEGYLLCKDVPIARTGIQLYRDGEVPVDADDEGLIKIMRPDQEVFDDAAMTSFQGKPVVLDHPDEDVNPSNWRQYAVGTVQNPRRGSDGYEGMLIADLLITDAEAIAAINDNGIREVSAGYDAEYSQDAPGHGAQHNIRGNHVALVDQGRCGPACRIGDAACVVRDSARSLTVDACCDECAERDGHSAPYEAEHASRSETPLHDREAKRKDTNMARLSDFIRRMRDAFPAADRRAFDKAYQDAVLGELEETAPPGTGDQPEREAPAGPHHVTVNVHPAGGAPERDQEQDLPPGTPTELGNTVQGPSGARVTPPGDQDPNGGADPSGLSLQSINERLLRMEAILQALVDDDGEEGEGGESAPPDNEEEGADRRFRDEGDLTEPETGEHISEMMGRDPIPNGTSRDRRGPARRGRNGQGRGRDAATVSLGRKDAQDVLARAEILAPGIRVPTFDAKSTDADIDRSLRRLERRAVLTFCDSREGEDIVRACLSDKSRTRDIEDLSDDAIHYAFNYASQVKGRNNRDRARGSGRVMHDTSPRKGPPTIAEINARNRAYWAEHGSA
jgi:hypothetical protein